MKRAQKTLMVAVIAGLFAGTLPALAVNDFQRGNDLYAKGQFQAAVDAYVDAICAAPKSYIPHYQLANTYMKLGRLGEAQTEYEMCLEMYPDAKTRAHTKKALQYITGSERGKAAVQDQVNPSKLDQQLAAEAARMQIDDMRALEQKKTAIEKSGAKQADAIKAGAKAQIEQMKLNSTWWAMSRDANDRVGVIAPEVEHAVLERADAQAAKVVEKAQEKAKALTPANAADVAEGLRTQIYNRGNSNVRLSPVGTNVYVRNYQSSGKVASSGEKTK
jgi:tetratricopeptide (TPR) repeat protein